VSKLFSLELLFTISFSARSSFFVFAGPGSLAILSLNALQLCVESIFTIDVAFWVFSCGDSCLLTKIQLSNFFGGGTFFCVYTVIS